MADDNLDLLLRTRNDSPMSLEQSKKFNNTKGKINELCRDLTLETQRYNPNSTVKKINSYISSADKLDRILYSEISNYVFSLDMAKRGIFATNLEKLLLYSLDDRNNVNDDSRELIIKLYDHFQLALHQIENSTNIFANSIEEAKKNISKEIKSVEREYITILGIFASIVLSFVGGITFSSSVLENISVVSIYRLLIVIDLLAFVLTNIIYLLVKFIFIINNNENAPKFNISYVNKICIIFAILIMLGWILNIESLSVFMKQFLPWCR